MIYCLYSNLVFFVEIYCVNADRRVRTFSPALWLSGRSLGILHTHNMRRLRTPIKAIMDSCFAKPRKASKLAKAGHKVLF